MWHLFYACALAAFPLERCSASFFRFLKAFVLDRAAVPCRAVRACGAVRCMHAHACASACVFCKMPVTN